MTGLLLVLWCKLGASSIVTLLGFGGGGGGIARDAGLIERVFFWGDISSWSWSWSWSWRLVVLEDGGAGEWGEFTCCCCCWWWR
jgi:hypothetical protein